MPDTNVGNISGELVFNIANAIKNIKTAETETKQLNKEVNDLEKSTKKAGKSTDKLGKDIDKAGKQSSRSAKSIDGFTKSTLSFTNAAKIGTAALLAMAVAGGKAASDIQSNFVGVRKTTGLSGDSFAMLRREILQLSGEIKGIDISEIQSIAAIAGQLGIRGTENISRFTEVVAKSAKAMELSADETANFLARITIATKEPISKVREFASVVNHLSNITPATAGEILNITNRMAGAAKTFGLTNPQIVALAATTKSLGVEVEVAGTAWSQILIKMLQDTKKFAKVAGVDIEEFTRMVKEEPLEAIKAFANGLSRFNKIARAQALNSLGTDGQRVGGILLKLATNVELLEKNVQEANKEWETATSVQEEYAVASDTLSASMSRLWNSLKLLSGAVFGFALKPLADLSDAISTLITGTIGLGKSYRDLSNDIQDEAAQADRLKNEFEELASKQQLSREEHEKLNMIAGQLLKIYPNLTIQYDRNGDAVSILASQYKKLIEAKKQDAILTEKKHLEELNEEYKKAERRIEKYTDLVLIQKKALDEFEKSRVAQRGGAFERGILETDLSSAFQNLQKEKRNIEKIKIELEETGKEINLLKGIEKPEPAENTETTPIPQDTGIDFVDDKDTGKRIKNAQTVADTVTQIERELAAERSGLSLEFLDLEEEKSERMLKNALLHANTLQSQLEAETSYTNDLISLATFRSDTESKELKRIQKEQLEGFDREREEAIKLAEDKVKAESQFTDKRIKLIQLHDDQRILQERRTQGEIERIQQEAAEREQNLREKQAREEQRILEKQQREFDRLMRERERSFRRIFEPLLDGGNFADILKRGLKEDLVDFAAQNFPLSIPFADQKGGIFNVLTSGLKQRDPVAEQIEKNTKDTVNETKQLKQVTSEIPINMGNILGAALGAFTSDEVNAGSIFKTFGFSLFGGLLNNVITGGFTPQPGSITPDGTMPFPEPVISTSPIPEAKGIAPKKQSTSILERALTPKFEFPKMQDIQQNKISMPSIKVKPFKVDGVSGNTTNNSSQNSSYVQNLTVNVQGGGQELSPKVAQQISRITEESTKRVLAKEVRTNGPIKQLMDRD